jgi:hypothetical protein
VSLDKSQALDPGVCTLWDLHRKSACVKILGFWAKVKVVKIMDVAINQMSLHHSLTNLPTHAGHGSLSASLHSAFPMPSILPTCPLTLVHHLLLPSPNWVTSHP